MMASLIRKGTTTKTKVKVKAKTKTKGKVTHAKKPRQGSSIPSSKRGTKKAPAHEAGLSSERELGFDENKALGIGGPDAEDSEYDDVQSDDDGEMSVDEDSTPDPKDE